MSLKLYLKPGEISHLEADINYTKVFMKNGQSHMFCYTLKRYEELPELAHFKRVSHKHLINPMEVKTIVTQGNKKTVILTCGTEISVTRRKVDRIRSLEMKFGF